ncbi:MAG TPA: sigma-70 family RNA polymerase sigma factor [Gemmatimonadales bacterium]
MTGSSGSRDRTADLLDEVRPGDARALDELVPIVYEELRAIARRHLAGERDGHTLDTTALAHEAYLRLVDDSRVTRRGRAYFFGAVARAMRQILVDHARKRGALKRGGGGDAITLEERHAMVDGFAAELLDLEAALARLARHGPRQARVVELRYFGGLDVPEVAEVLGISTRTVELDWAMARAWLFRELGGEPRDDR